MNLFLYLDKNTWVHRLDPRTKMISVLMFFSICLCFNHPLYMAIISLGILLVTISAKSLLNIWRLRFILILLILFSIGMWPFFVFLDLVTFLSPLTDKIKGCILGIAAFFFNVFKYPHKEYG